MLANSNYITKAGEISIRETKRGIEFHAFNHERGRLLHVGTLSGVTYEKVAVILRQPEPSFALTFSEWAAVQETGAEFIRIIPPDKSATFSISIQDFDRLKCEYFNPSYGKQYRIPISKFQSISRVGKRNAVLDNPVKEQPRPLIPEYKQPSLFGTREGA